LDSKLKQNLNTHANGKLLENTPEEDNVATSRRHATKQNAKNILKNVNLLDQPSQEFTFQNVNGSEEDHSREEENVAIFQKDVKMTNAKQERFLVNSPLEFSSTDVDGKRLQDVLTKSQLLATILHL
jgi:hypothetical protein